MAEFLKKIFLLSKNWKFYIIICFIASRFFIFATPPPYYSDVKADYERYANIWYYGLPPYLEHLYEYPPSTVPMLLLPLVLDQMGIGKYYPNYRIEILLIDIVFFIFLFKSILKLNLTNKTKYRSLYLYLFLTTLTRAFFYEGIDLAYTAAIISSFLILLWQKKNSWKGKILSWTFFWLSTSIKFLTFPMIIPLYLVTRSNFKKDILAIVAGFLIVWGLPLMIFRSSLMVSFVYNNARPLKYASFPAYIVESINVFTKSEVPLNKAPDFPLQGPVADVITKVNKVSFPVILMIYLILVAFFIAKKQQINLKKLFNFDKKELVSLFKFKNPLNNEMQFHLLLKIYGLYIFILFLTAKIFSQPFHIWYLPVLALLQFKKEKHWYFMIALVLLMLLLDMTTILAIPKLDCIRDYKKYIQIVRGGMRFLPMLVMIVLIKGSLREETK
ncbi:MAG: hypothetical protein PVJ09_04680 [Candidatus Woesebacteria bacterium]|jgi:hypothetical protein